MQRSQYCPHLPLTFLRHVTVALSPNSVEIATGNVLPIASGVALKYFSPACDDVDGAVFSVYLGENQQSTELLSVDLANATISARAIAQGEVTSAVESSGSFIGVMGNELISLPHSSTDHKPVLPTKLAGVAGAAFNLRPNRAGMIDFLTTTPDNAKTSLFRWNGKTVEALGQGETATVGLFGGRNGKNVVSGVDANAPGVKTVNPAQQGQSMASSSLDGDAIVFPLPTDHLDKPSSTTAATVPQATRMVSTATGKYVDQKYDQTATKVFTEASAEIPAGVADDGNNAERNTIAPKGSKLFAPDAQKLSTDAAPEQKSSQSLANDAPICSVARLDPAMQVMQPSNSQVTWAAQMAEQGLLTGSAYARPQNFENMGLVPYSPSDDFPPISLDHPAGTTDLVPRSVMLGILAQESNFNQASWHALPSVPADPLIANYYGVAGSIDQIDYPNADCGYGLAQVTTGMRAGDGSFSHHGQMKIAADYQENIAAGLEILQSTWNQLYESGIIANNGDPSKLENWYFALWAYNSGIQPTAAYGNTTGCTPSATCTGTDGTWGLGWSNNPRNPAYPPNRKPFLQSTYADAAHPGDWPYQERVLGWMASPIIRYGYFGYGTPDYHGSSWVKIPSVNAMCDDSNHCNPNDASGSYCSLSDYECWWHKPVTWVSDCATSCATSAYDYGAGTTEPSHADPHPPTCSLGPTVPSGPGGAPIIVDDEPSPPLHIAGCGQINWSSNGNFTMDYGKKAQGVTVGQIDMHQLGVGFGGRILFTHTESASDTAVIDKGTWTPNLPSLQYYKIKLHLPEAGATATDVVYTINPGGGVAPWKIRVNQDWGSEQWATIGTFAMQNGGSISLDNASNMDGGIFDVAYDAVAFIPMGGSPGTPIGGPQGIQDAPKGSNPAFVNCGCVQRTAGDPVRTQTGYFGESITDLSTPGNGMALNLSRSYASAVADPNGPNKTLAQNGPFGWGWSYSYGLSATTAANGDVVIHQEDGSQVAFKLSGSTYTTAAPRFDATLSKSGSTYSYARRGTSFFTFDASTGRFSQETDLAGTKASPAYWTKLSYDSAGLLNQVTDPAGRSYTFGWAAGHITSVKDPANREVDYGYDASGNLTDVYGVGTSRSDDDHAVFGYSAADLITSMTKPANFGKSATPAPVTSMVYDGQERVTSQTDAIGQVTKFVYGPDSANNLVAGQTLVTDPAGHKTLDRYDANGLLTSETKGWSTADAGTWTYTYDPISLGISTSRDPDGHTQTFAYDDHGNKVSSSDPAGNTTPMAYDDAGHNVLSVSPSGLRSATTYTAAGMPSQVSLSDTALGTDVGNSTGTVGNPDVRVTKFDYADAAHPSERTSTTDALGKSSTSGYDNFGDVVSNTDPLGNKTLFRYDTLTGRRTSMVTPEGFAAGVAAGCSPPAKGCTSFGFNAWGLQTSVIDALGHKSSAVFDANGRKVSDTDANSHTTTTTFDPIGQATSVTMADGSNTSTSYTASGKVLEQVDGLGKHTKYGYDGQHRAITLTDADGHMTSTAYDPAGLKKPSTDPRNVVATFGYDSAGRMASLKYSDGTAGVSAVSYDLDGRQTGLTDGTGASVWSYDVFGELLSHRNGAGARVLYGYDADWHESSIAYPGQQTPVQQGYDDAGRLQSITDFSGNKITVGYNHNSQVTSLGYPNGTAVNSVFDDADQLSSSALVKGSITLASLSYARDNANQLTGQTPTGLPGAAEKYSYNSVNEVTSETSGPTSLSYGYDAAHNATTVRNGTQAFSAS